MKNVPILNNIPDFRLILIVTFWPLSLLEKIIIDVRMIFFLLHGKILNHTYFFECG